MSYKSSPNRENVSFFKNMKIYFVDYCRSSSIHGLSHLVENRTKFERSWWLLVFLTCLGFCAYTILLVYQKWDSSPVIISVSTHETPIYKIPFPAVTICPVGKQFTIDMQGNKKNRLNFVSCISILCASYDQPEFKVQNMKDKRKNSLIKKQSKRWGVKPTDFFDTLTNISPNFVDAYLESCKWRKKEFNCSEIMKIIITDEGLCASFNIFEYSHIYNDDVYWPYKDSLINGTNSTKPKLWSLDDGYSTSTYTDEYPYRALYAGVKNGLEINLKNPLIKNEDNSTKLNIECAGAFKGFKVLLHTPSRIPRIKQQFIMVPEKQLVMVGVKPVMITTTSTVKKFNYEKRQCYFQSERQLRFFKQYTQKNCELECLTNITKRWCFCSEFFMPRKGVRICGSRLQSCVEEAEEFYRVGMLELNFGDKKIRKEKDNNRSFNNELLSEVELEPLRRELKNCNCLPLCSDLSYEVDSSSTSERNNRSRLVVYFQKSLFMTSKRHELYGPTDFLANFGGLLGLFTGFSILSLMEIVYFLTVRICSNLSIYGVWYGSKKN